MEKILYAQIDGELYAAVDRAAELAGISKKQIIESMIAKAAGQPHKHANHTVTAWSKYRRQGWWASDKANR